MMGRPEDFRQASDGVLDEYVKTGDFVEVGGGVGGSWAALYPVWWCRLLLKRQHAVIEEAQGMNKEET